jgi:hypothetical protein
LHQHVDTITKGAFVSLPKEKAFANRRIRLNAAGSRNGGVNAVKKADYTLHATCVKLLS